MDPFEVRMRFITLLKGLNASQASALKAAQLALKHKDMLEDLHSCILEQLEEENSSINARANIMCFVEVYMETAKAEGNTQSIELMQRDMQQIVQKVVLDDLTGVINAPLTKQVITNMHSKGLIPSDAFEVLRDYLADSDSLAAEAVTRHYAAMGRMSDGTASAQDILTATGAAGGIPLPEPLDRKQVEQRVEEDRERHKRLREHIWAVAEDDEVARLWEDPVELDEDDYRLMQEESQERYRSIVRCPVHGRAAIKEFAEVKWTDGYVWPEEPEAAEVEAEEMEISVVAAADEADQAAAATATAATLATATASAPRGPGGQRFGKQPPRGPKGPHRGFPRPRGPKHPRGGGGGKFPRGS